MRTPNLFPAAALAALSLAACTPEQRYNSAQGWQQSQCKGIHDKMEYDRCMARAGSSYDSYKRETESRQK